MLFYEGFYVLAICYAEVGLDVSLGFELVQSCEVFFGVMWDAEEGIAVGWGRCDPDMRVVQFR